MFVVTVDQRGSRRDRDRVPDLLGAVTDLTFVRPFDRTAGDEAQAVTDRADVVVETALRLAATGHWSIGIGLGDVDRPLPDSTRAGRGPAFVAAREAVERAKNAPAHVAVDGPDLDATADAEAALSLVCALVARRSDRGHEAVALVRDGLSQLEAADRAGITKQAMSQRLMAAGWELEQGGRRLATRLLERADVGAAG